MRKIEIATGRILNEAPAAIVEKGEIRWNPRSPVTQAPGEVPEDMQERMYKSLPPVVRRVPRQRFEQVLQTLINDAREKFQRTGYIAWPQSVINELKALGWQEGKPDMHNEVLLLARKYIEQGENRGKEVAGKFVTTPGHGH